MMSETERDLARQLSAANAALEQVEAAIKEVGLPQNVSVADLIRHHRNNAALAAGFDKLRLERVEAQRDRYREALEALYEWSKDYDAHTPRQLQAYAALHPKERDE